MKPNVRPVPQRLHTDVSFRFRWNFSQERLHGVESSSFKINSRDLQMKSEVNVNVTVANSQRIASLLYLICAPRSTICPKAWAEVAPASEL